MNSKLNKYSFLINSKTNKKIYINNIYGSISIYNIENYLKRIESLKNTNNSYLEVIVIPNKLIYDLEHILWAIFIAKNRIEDEINISKDLFRETLLVLSGSDQLSKISKEYYIQEGKQEVFINIISEKEINDKNLQEVKDKLDIETKEINDSIFNKKKLLDYYNLKNKENIINEIIEKMLLL